MPDLLPLLSALCRLLMLAAWPCLFLPLLFLRRPRASRTRPMRLRVIAQDGSERRIDVLPSREAFQQALRRRPRAGQDGVQVLLHSKAR